MPYAFNVASGTLTTKSRHKIERTSDSSTTYHIQENEVLLSYTNNSNGTVDWTITINKSYSQQYTDDTYKTKSGSAVQPAVYMYLKIGNEEVINKRYSYGWNTTNHAWGDFPNKAGTSVSGTVSVDNSQSGNISIVLESWVYYTNNPNDTSGYVEKASTSVTKTYWTANSAGGAISVTDNGNNTVTINVPDFVEGTNNSISPDPNNGYESNYVYIRFHTASGNINKLKSNTGKYTLDLEPDTYEISVWAKVCSKYGADIEKKLLNVSVKYYTPPKAPTKMWINTAKKSQYPDNVKSSYKPSGTSSMAENDAIKPRLKNLLMWKWSGYSGGTNAPVAGFRVFIFKNSTTCLASNSVKVTDLYGINTTTEGTKSLVDIGSAEVGNNSLGDYYDIGVDLDNETDTQFGFIPIDNGFTKKDTCTCKVYTYSYWGDKDSSGNKKKHFSDAAFDGELDYLTGSCTLFSSAVVHVKTTNGWIEGTPYVKTAEDTWTEADSVYIKTATDTWTEST